MHALTVPRLQLALNHSLHTHASATLKSVATPTPTLLLCKQVIRAMENQSLFGDARPNCIILDEIDGAEGKAAIEALLAIITAPLPQLSSTKNSTGSSSGRRGSSSQHALTRPLIVICNNQYAPHLRALRQVATVFAFRRTTPQRLAQRLKVICAAERIGARYVSMLSTSILWMNFYTTALPQCLTCVLLALCHRPVLRCNTTGIQLLYSVCTALLLLHCTLYALHRTRQ